MFKSYKIRREENFVLVSLITSPEMLHKRSYVVCLKMENSVINQDWTILIFEVAFLT
jgi:hypothetical protein